ncbi:MAG: type I methionyl aminopeptidase [Bdellovibrionales bacterium]|nr:type I methionyl aminopeptidase [Bdellovibrionales bacterium]MBT3526442.1 type I methionyl aminopeptidase [Bdellovibrionales bacterium]MBT7765712.1 type I methionyl aminopeptidase [Bdellovibrionales bacterium]
MPVINIKTKWETDLMRASCRLAADTLDYIEPFVQPGVNTLKLNDLCHKFILEHGAIPSPLNYHGFPKSICISPNQVICHGIPKRKVVLKSGDIVNLDVTVFLNGFHGDTNRTFFVGEVASHAKKLVDVTYQCMWRGIEQVRPSGRIGDIGAAITLLAHSHNYSVVEDYCGHGIGREFHEDPQVVHFGQAGTGHEMKAGMTFTIEPMINVGKKECKVLKDKWTVETYDNSLSAQFEHTILVTDVGYEVLTLGTRERELNVNPTTSSHLS